MGSRPTSAPPLELWAGLECTVNRVRDEYYDQLVRTGHDRRLTDLDLLAWLGAKAVRYPVLWERVAPDGLATADWTWTDERLARLRELEIRPIAGLVHHGSGPRSTSLVDPEFPEKLAEYARAAAERYPWVASWTPVNEPLTTARFSGLYGHWYPHGRDDATFARCLLHQCQAVVLAMRAIREVIPHAQLVQTDDLGHTHSTPRLRYQQDLENERRWVTFDLLTGGLTPDMLMWAWLRDVASVPEHELEWFLENPCPPDIIGLNHYLSSERFLDEREELYPPDSHGGNGKDRYADILAARVLVEGPAGPAALFQEAWDRFGRPLAITEAHNGCTREEQLRWLLEVWRAAEAVRDKGADLRAVTVWSTFGVSGWSTLCATPDEFYEPGIFDVRNGTPRPTALAHLARALGRAEPYEHPAADGPGWWRRPERIWYPPIRLGESRNGWAPRAATRALLVTGATGTLGQAFARGCESRGLPYRLTTRQELDIAAADSVAAALDEIRPWGVVNTAGFVRVDEAEDEPDGCRRENTEGARLLAEACAARGVGLVAFSSDLVFDGAKRTPYMESDPPKPLNVYGLTKLEAERATLAAHPGALVARTSAFFGPADEHNFVTVALAALAAGEPFRAADDGFVSPTYVPHLVDAVLDLLIDGEAGVWHLANEGETSWAGLARMAATLCDVPADSLEPVATADLGLRAPRPPYSVLGSERGVLLPTLDDALAAYAAARPALVTT
jgi:dTDP-4-dehydrorhamnose reductase